MKLIIGLGNPGKIYAHNRHNTGFRCINYLARQYSISVKQRQCRSQVGIGDMVGTESLLAKPQTFVNNSGEAVRCLLRLHKTSPEDLVIICDDLDLPLGKLRLRQGGGSGGHKGLKSIISAVGSQDFCRIRVGVGRPAKEDGTPIADEDVIVNYVLSDFIAQEERIISAAIAAMAEAVRCVITEGITVAMSKFN